MDAKLEKLKGTLNSAMGNLKETAGWALGNKNLQSEGAGQKAKGKAQKFKSSVQNTLKKDNDLSHTRSKPSSVWPDKK